MFYIQVIRLETVPAARAGREGGGGKKKQFKTAIAWISFWEVFHGPKGSNFAWFIKGGFYGVEINLVILQNFEMGKGQTEMNKQNLTKHS